MTHDLTHFFSGAFFLAAAAIMLIFARSYVRSGDRLFAWFAWAFGLLAAERLGAVLTNVDPEAHAPLAYVLRLIAFLIIIAGIVEKNR